MILNNMILHASADPDPFLPSGGKVYITHGMFVEVRFSGIKMDPADWDLDVYPMFCDDRGVNGFISTFYGLRALRREYNQ